jgi:hypothetical protein
LIRRIDQARALPLPIGTPLAVCCLLLFYLQATAHRQAISKELWDALAAFEQIDRPPNISTGRTRVVRDYPSRTSSDKTALSEKRITPLRQKTCQKNVTVF